MYLHLPTHYRPSLRLARLAVLVGAVEFILRALVRTKSDWLSDLAAPYTSARFWLAGSNPYNPFAFFAEWRASGAPNLGLSDFVSGAHSVYPPPTLLLIAPLTLLRWQSAVHAFVILGLIFYFASIYAMVRLARPQHRGFSDIATDPLALLFIAIALGFAPVHAAFHSLNIVLFASCAAMLAIAFTFRLDSVGRGDLKKMILVGTAVTLAILLKPTTGIFLLPWLAYERRWRLIAAILVACGVITVLSLAPLMAHQGMSWLADYRQNVSALFTDGGNADVSHQNIYNTDRIDLQLVAFALLGNRTLASAAAALVYIALLSVFLKQAGWGMTSAQGKHNFDLPLLIAAGCLALGLLPSYTRVYAAVVLLPLALWCLTHLQLSAARCIMLLLSDFLLNTSAIIRLLGEKAEVINHNPRAWDFTIGGHTCWLLLGIGFLLPLAVRQQIRNAELLPSPALPVH